MGKIAYKNINVCNFSEKAHYKVGLVTTSLLFGMNIADLDEIRHWDLQWQTDNQFVQVNRLVPRLAVRNKNLRSVQTPVLRVPGKVTEV